MRCEGGSGVRERGPRQEPHVSHQTGQDAVPWESLPRSCICPQAGGPWPHPAHHSLQRGPMGARRHMAGESGQAALCRDPPLQTQVRSLRVIFSQVQHGRGGGQWPRSLGPQPPAAAQPGALGGPQTARSWGGRRKWGRGGRGAGPKPPGLEVPVSGASGATDPHWPLWSHSLLWGLPPLQAQHTAGAQ